MEIIREVISSAWVPALLIIFMVAVTAKGLKDFVSENPDSPTARFLTDNEKPEKQTEAIHTGISEYMISEKSHPRDD